MLNSGPRKRVTRLWIAAAAMAVIALLPTAGRAQLNAAPVATPLPRNLLGAPPKALDILDLSTGMPCPDAVALVKQRVGAQRIIQRFSQIGGTSVSWLRNFEVSHTLAEPGRSPINETFYVDCSGAGSGNQVLEIKRTLSYPDTAQLSVPDLLTQLHSKYGKPNAEHGIAYLFEGEKEPNGRKCPDFPEQSNVFATSRTTYMITDDRVTCIFALQIWLSRGRAPDRASSASFIASDFLRGRESRRIDIAFERAVREHVIRRTPTTSAPRL